MGTEAATAPETATEEPFLAQLSTALQARLSGVLGLTYLLFDTGLDVGQIGIARAIHKACEDLLVPLENVAELGRLRSTAVPAASAEFRLHAAVRSVVASAVFRASAKDLRLRCHVEPDVPRLAVGDESTLRKAVGNLVRNAVEHGEMGDVLVRVAVDGATSPARGAEPPPPAFTIRVTVTLTDSCSGLPPDGCGARFWLDDDVATTDAECPWRGLGLALSRRLVHAAGGEVGAGGDPEAGASFWFRLPVRRRSAGESSTGASWNEELPILLITDDAAVRCQALVALTRVGYRVELRTDRGRFKDTMWAGSYGLVLLDGEDPDHLVTFASWGTGSGVHEVRVFGVPKLGRDRDRGGAVDVDRLLELVGGKHVDPCRP